MRVGLKTENIHQRGINNKPSDINFKAKIDAEHFDLFLSNLDTFFGKSKKTENFKKKFMSLKPSIESLKIDNEDPFVVVVSKIENPNSKLYKKILYTIGVSTEKYEDSLTSYVEKHSIASIFSKQFAKVFISDIKDVIEKINNTAPKSRKKVLNIKGINDAFIYK